MRTVFFETEEGLVQQILSNTEVTLYQHDFSYLSQSERDYSIELLSKKLAKEPFDLKKYPLFRFHLVNISPSENIFIIVLHHIITDGWSMSILVKELSHFYQDFQQGNTSIIDEVSLQYTDYALWQKEWLMGPIYKRQLSYWKNQLNGIQSLTQLPIDAIRPKIKSYTGKTLNFSLTKSLTDRLIKLTKEYNTTSFMLLLACFGLLLYRYSNQDDICIGTPIANRTRKQLENIMGFFVNTIVLRLNFIGEKDFVFLLKQTRDICLQAYQNQDFPFEKLVEELQPERDLSISPLFQVMFAFQNMERKDLSLTGLTLKVEEISTQTAKFDVFLSMWEEGEVFKGVFEYDDKLFLPDTISKMQEHFIFLLERISENPTIQLKNFIFVNSDNNFKEISLKKYEFICDSILDLFKQQVLIRPGAVAASFNDKYISYSELEKQSTLLAQNLMLHGVKTCTIIGLYANRSLEMLISILAIFKLGCAYLPLDPAQPYDRNHSIIIDAKINTLLIEADGEAIYFPGIDQLNIRALLREKKSNNISLPTVNSKQLAYVIYTSGSTGKPKGVMISHEALLNRLVWMKNEFSLDHNEVFIQKTPFTFDVSVWELILPIICGAKLVFIGIDVHKDPLALIKIINNENTSIIHFVPSMLHQFIEMKKNRTCPSLKRIIASGEALSPAIVKKVYAECPNIYLYNLYGPTEAAIDVSYWQCFPQTNLRTVPIGKPISNMMMYVLNDDLQVLPVNIVGKLFLSGVGIAWGYLYRPELTSERFIPDFISGIPGQRMYDTGDLARIMTDGNIEYLGRSDQQIKLRGFRIEPSEIENAINSNLDNAQTIVISSGENENQQLTAYVVCADKNFLELENQFYEKHIKSWQNIYDETYKSNDVINPLLNFTGWNSSKTGAPIPISQMLEWHAEIINRIKLFKLGDVLEIGCGTGLMLFHLVKQCNSYIATDISKTSLNYILDQLSIINKSLPSITLLHKPAHDLADFASHQVDTILMNSTIQYFPSVNYLLDVFAELIAKVRDNGRIFIGDVRNLGTLPDFYSWRNNKILNEDEISNFLYNETELALSPLFFYKLKLTHDRVHTVEILPKKAQGDNELVKFRYDVNLHIGEKNKNFFPSPAAEVLLVNHSLLDLADLSYQQLANNPLKSLFAQEKKAIIIKNLRNLLPDYMIPTHFIFLDKFLLTANGKIDRKALPAFNQARFYDVSRYVEPETEIEHLLVKIWSQVLSQAQIGMMDNFFDLGGHSLLATQVVARIEDELHVEIPLRKFFELPTIRGLSAYIESLWQNGTKKEIQEITPVDKNQAHVLSYSQQRLWFLWKFNPSSPFYNMAGGVKLEGEINKEVLHKTFKKIYERHTILRTCFKEKKGEILQIILDQPLNYQVTDLSELTENDREQEIIKLTRLEGLKPFNLETGDLFRIHLVKLTEMEHLLLINMHHIISDGWSIGILIKEMSTFYSTYLKGEPEECVDLPLQYVDYAVWQRHYLKENILEKSLLYWRNQLSGAPRYLDLPTDYPRPLIQSHHGAQESIILDIELSNQLQRWSHKQGITLFMLLFAGYVVLLNRYSGQEDISVGIPIANRQRKDLENLIGFFVNTLVLRVSTDDDPRFIDFITEIKEVCLEAYAHQDLPFEKLVEELQPERDLSRSPLFQVMFVLQNMPMEDLELPGLTLKSIEGKSEISKFDLTLDISRLADGRLRCAFEYNSDLFEVNRIKRMCGHYRELLKGIVVQPSSRLSELPLLTTEEYRQITQEWNKPIHLEEAGVSVLELFGEQVRKLPQAIAIEFSDKQISYDELDKRSSQLANYLRLLGIGTESLVGLCLPRGIDLIVGLLGILKSGGAYVPLDPAYPQARLSYMIEDSQVKVVVSHSEVLEQLQGKVNHLILLDEIDLNSYSNELALVNEPHSLAYVIYTSGSTGQPKGVALSYKALNNLINWQLKENTLLSFATTAQFASINFDASFQEIFITFCSGAKLILITEEQRRNSETLLNILIEYKVERLFIPYVGLHGLAESANFLNKYPVNLKEILTAGEQLKITPILKKFFENLPTTRLVNFYGPSESHVVSSYSLTKKINTWEEYPPIGKSIINTQLYILDKYLRIVPIGVPGQLYIGGVNLGRGYFNKPELTADRFIPNPYARSLTENRLYVSGDTVRYIEDGNIEFLERKDDQVKIRGYRVELNEVINHLLSIPGVIKAVVLKQSSSYTTSLIAFIKKDNSAIDLTAHYISQKLAEILPEYYLPSQYVFLSDFPMTINGKIDKEALLCQGKDIKIARNEYIAPQTYTQQQLTIIWSELLGISAVSIDDNFFKIGGHSLLATKLISKIQTFFKKQFPLQKIFQYPTIRKLSTQIDKVSNKCTEPLLVNIPRADKNKQKLLSFAQQRLWFLARLEPDSAYYNMPSAIKLTGKFDPESFIYAINEVIKRHQILRTTFNNFNGTPVQVIHQNNQQKYPIIDLSDKSSVENIVQNICDEDAKKPFNLEKGPLCRFNIIKLSVNAHVVLFNFHHIVFDGWSTALFVEELCNFYNSRVVKQDFSYEELPIQYSDYAIWQQESQVGTIDEQLEYWLNKLKNVPLNIDIPTDKPRPAFMNYNGDVYTWVIPREICKKIQQNVNREEVTLFMYLLCIFSTLLYRYSQQADFCIGTPIANRRVSEIEKLIGFFTNTLVIRCKFDFGLTFQNLLSQIKESCVEAFAHQEAPFERLVEKLHPVRDMSRTPIFQVMFALQNTPEPKMNLLDLELSSINIHSRTSKFDLFLSIRENLEELNCVLEYNTDLFEPATIARMAEHFNNILAITLDKIKTPITYLSYLTKAELTQLAGWNNTQKSIPKNLTVDELISAKLLEHAHRPFIQMNKNIMTYREVDILSNRLANYLINNFSVGPECYIGVSVERSIMMLVSILAIIKTGAAYVPLDPYYPEERLAYMLSNANVQLLLTQEQYVNKFSKLNINCIDINYISDEIANSNSQRPKVNIYPDNIVYITYTSGSTGRPKGIMMPHGPLINLLFWHQRNNSLPIGSKTIQFASLSFDVSFQDIFSTIMSGGILKLINENQRNQISKLAHLIVEEDIERVFLPAVVLQQLIGGFNKNQQKNKLKQIISGSEQLQLQEGLIHLFDESLSSCELRNEYGPSEAHVVTSYIATRPLRNHAAWVPIGKPLDNVVIYILDKNLQHVPVGFPGEIYIGGVSLTRGYIQQADITAQVFLPDPFASNIPGARMYKTGDFAHYLLDGNIEYLGRIDNQVKIRGFRVELSEIDIALANVSKIKEALTIACDDPNTSSKLLVCYLVTNDKNLDATKVRYHLKHLPDYMIPTHFIFLDKFLLTANGKIDRKALPAFNQARFYDVSRYVEPETEIEHLLVKIWSQVLSQAQIGMMDNFFDLGGHSLLATQVVARIEDELHVEIPLRKFFELPTIRGLSAYIESLWQNGTKKEIQEITPVDKNQAHVLSYSQQRLWFLWKFNPSSPFYNMAGGVKLEGEINKEVLHKTFKKIYERHTILRTCFKEKKGEILQIILDQPLNYQVTDLSELTENDREQEIIKLTRLEGLKPFNLETGDLFRIHLVKLTEMEHLLLINMHHIISDGWSIGILIKEMSTFYSTYLKGEPEECVDLPLQYVDYAVWQRHYLKENILEKSLLYWRNQLSGAPRYLDLPTDYPRPLIQVIMVRKKV